MRRATTFLLTAAVLAAVGCGDETSAGAGGSGTGSDGTGGDGTGAAGGGTTTSTSTASTGSGDGGAGGGAGGGGPSFCGNGVVESDEACDDGGESATCDVDCTPAACGDAVLNVTAGEACDEAGETAECDLDCTPASCGDATVNAAAGETCDDGGRSAACNADCTSASCGDGVVNAAAGEECDDGNDVTTDACIACQAAACGDGFVQDGIETCDDGGTAPGDGCSADCQSELHPQCGQPYAVLNTADRNVEYNDQGATVYCDAGGVSPGWVGVGWYRFEGEAGTMMPGAPPPPFSCATHASGWLNGEHPDVAEGVVERQVCWSYTPGPCWQVGSIEVVNCGDFYLYNLTTPVSCSYRYCGTTCGDGVVDPGETCDDGNLVDGDGCPRGCGQPVCGNGVVDGGEQCDDGNTTAGDGCSSTCQAEVDPQCFQPVITLSAADRNVTFNDGEGGLEYCDDPSFLQSPDFQGDAWYRFTGSAGTRMPTTPPAIYACGTDAPGWLNGAHPSVGEGIVGRQACFNWGGNTCNWDAAVDVVNCGDHYRYRLPYTGICSLRYCGTN